MRSFVASLLAVAALSCFGCATAEDRPASSQQSVYGEMGLELGYDERSRTIRATVQRAIAADETLLLRIRRGRLSSRQPESFECSALSPAPPIGGDPIAYQGPPIDPVILAAVYNQEWIERNITTEELSRLEREGSDAIVEACIVRGSAAVSRVQTSLPNAWDPDDPYLARR
jgi:hypothetical protein